MPTELDRRVAAGEVPPSLRDVLMPFAWRLDRLRSLELERVEVDVASFAWMLELPLWRQDGEIFAVTPRQVCESPEKFAEQWARTQQADLSWPVYVTPRERRLVIIDGVHRLLRARDEGVGRLPALLLPPNRWQEIRPRRA